LFKIVLVGDSGVGKSCLLLRFADDTFSESYISTIGVDFRFKTLSIDGQIVKLQIWDTAGQERFKTITSAYYRGADGVILVFDKTSRDTFNNIASWLEEINKYSETSTRILVGNKDDAKEIMQVDQETAIKFGSELKMNYVETSALNSHQVTFAFESIARELIAKRATSVEKGKKLSPGQPKPIGNCCGSF
jgi:Ras-related protein Rab-1A